MHEGQTTAVSVEVTNKGTRAGTAMVQLYVRDLVASVTRPLPPVVPSNSTNVAVAVPCASPSQGLALGAINASLKDLESGALQRVLDSISKS